MKPKAPMHSTKQHCSIRETFIGIPFSILNSSSSAGKYNDSSLTIETSLVKRLAEEGLRDGFSVAAP
jgi:hypothetical protein